MTKVFYGPYDVHPFLLAWEPLVPLAKSLKEFHGRQTESILRCPSYTSATANMYAVFCPVDISIEIARDQEGNVWPHVFCTDGTFGMGRTQIGETSPVLNSSGPPIGTSENIYQFLADKYLLMFSSESCKIEIYPPYLHHGKIFGVAGSFDIGEWFRPISFSGFCFDKPVQIKAGEPMMYIRLPSNTKLHRVLWPHDIQLYINHAVTFKAGLGNKPLSLMYDRFKRSGLKKKILKIAEQSIV